MKNTRASGWVVMVGLVSASALGGCDLVAGIGEFCEIGVDPGCGTGGTGGAGGGGTGGTTTSPTGGGGTGGASGCSPMGTEQPCYSGPDGTQDVGICVGGTQTCQADGTWGLCEGQVEPGIETCASTDDEDCDAKECALWSKIFGDTDQQFPLGVAIDGQGNIVVLGYFKGTIDFGGGQLDSAGGSYDLFLARFKHDGQLVWGKRYGDSADQLRASLALDSSGNIIVAGAFQGALDFGGKMVTAIAGGTDVFLVKLSPGGAPAWVNRYGDAADQSAWDVVVDSNDDILMIGEFAGSLSLKNTITPMNGTDIWVGRIDGFDGTPLGEAQFDDKAGQSGTLNIAAGPAGTWAISGLHGNGAMIGGSTLSGMGSFVAKYDANDSAVWSVHLPLSTPSATLIDASGDVVMAGDFYSAVDIGGSMLTSKGIADIAVVKLGARDGAIQWVKDFGGQGNEQAARLKADEAGNLFLAVSAGSPSIDFGGGELAGKGLEDLFVVALNGDGSHRWSRGVGDATAQGAPRIASDSLGKSLVVAALTNGTINFGAGDLNSNGNDIALAKLAP